MLSFFLFKQLSDLTRATSTEGLTKPLGKILQFQQRALTRTEKILQEN